MKILTEYNPDEHEIISEVLIGPDGDEFFYVITEAKNISFVTKSVSAVKGFKDFLKKHPYMTGMAVGIGINALDSYRSNKRLVTRFFATNPIERKLYKKVADDLVKDGNYTLLKNGKRIKGGWLWELKRRAF